MSVYPPTVARKRFGKYIPTATNTQNYRQIQNYWVCGLYPSSGILETREHNVSETGFIPSQHAYEEGHRVRWDEARILETK
jgi:hypothetical protein